MNSPHKSQWRGALMFSVICVWINGWVNNREAGDLRRYRAHYNVIVMHHGINVRPYHYLSTPSQVFHYHWDSYDASASEAIPIWWTLVILPAQPTNKSLDFMLLDPDFASCKRNIPAWIIQYNCCWWDGSKQRHTVNNDGANCIGQTSSSSSMTHIFICLLWYWKIT